MEKDRPGSSSRDKAARQYKNNGGLEKGHGKGGLEKGMAKEAWKKAMTTEAWKKANQSEVELTGRLAWI